MKKAIRLILLVAVLGIGGWYWWKSQHPDNTGRLFVSGNLELTQVDISFKIAGRMIERKVNEGDWVKKNDVIATLDPAQLRQQKFRDTALVSSAVSNKSTAPSLRAKDVA